MNYDQYLSSLRDKYYEAPDYYIDCVACPYAHDPENVTMISETEDMADTLIEIFGDDPTDYICDECLKKYRKG